MSRHLRPWLVASALGVVSLAWLLWAFPRLHASTRLGLQFDREGYLSVARRTAATQGRDVTGWRGYVEAETLTKNQDFHVRMPADPMARAFPDADVQTNFLPNGSGQGAHLTLRPDGRPLSWKIPPPPEKPSGKTMPSTPAAHGAMEAMTGPDAGNYLVTSDGVAESDGMDYKWTRSAKATPATGTDAAPRINIEASVKNGVVWQTKTTFTLPRSVTKRLNSFSTLQVILSATWFVFLIAAIVIPVLREGSGITARAMKDSSAIKLSTVAALAVALASIISWDDELISVTFASGLAIEVLGVVLGSVIVGLLFYSMCAATVLNARLHPGRVRGFRLLGTRAFFSRTVGAEVLGGWLLAPAIVSFPLIVAALMRTAAFKGYDDGFILSRLPVLDALSNAVAQETVSVAAFLGVLIPLAIRFSRQGRIRLSIIAVFATLTFVTLTTPFHTSMPANFAAAALEGLTMTWLYSRFGMLGALSAHCSARVLTSAGVLLVQPSVSLHASGWGIVFAFCGLGLVALVASIKGPDVVAELYGESGVRVQARSRREELLAEFNVARSAQQQMLPSQPPVLEGYTISASCDPAREVGGDLYDFLRLSDGRWGIGVADVSGKGVPAALYMTLTKGLLCAASQDSGDPRQILGAVNKHLRTVTKKKMFVTMALGVLDPAERRVEYVRAGHNPVVWRRHAANETRLLAGPGIGLGIAGPVLFAKTLATETIELSPGDALVFYSDGLTEAMDETLEQFGDDRLVAAVENADGMHAKDTRDSILGEVRRFLKGVHPQDDLTIAVLRVNAEGGGVQTSAVQTGDN